MRKSLFALLMAAILVNASGCATVVKGPYQPIGITSNPGGALVKVDGVDKGETPMVIKMARRRAHTVQLDKEGYQSYEASISTHPGGWIWGNIFIGGLIGLAVDLITGASNNLEPDSVHAELAPK